MDPLPLSIRDPVKFRLESVHNKASRDLVRVMDKAMKGEIAKDDVPGYALGAKIALGIWERTAPVPKVAVEANVLGDLVITWQTPEPSSSPTLPARSRPSSTTPSLPSGLAPPSSSATDDLASL